MSRPSLRRLSFLASLCGLALTGCVEDYPPANLEPSGSARVVVLLPRSQSADALGGVTASAPDEGRDVSTELTRAEGLWEGRLWGLQTGGARPFRAQLVDASGTPLSELQASATILSRRQAQVFLVVPEVLAAEPDGNIPPVLEAVVSSGTRVVPGEAVALRAFARDPNPGDTLTYTWRASEGSFEEAGADVPRWTAPTEPGLYTLTVVVTDAAGAAVSLEFEVEVGSTGGPGSLGTPVLFNRWPRLSGFRVQPEDDVPVGRPVTLAATGTDVDGDTLTYRWTASCPGELVNGNTGSATFTPSALPESSTCDNCTLSVTVDDGHGGQRTTSTGVCVRDSLPPAIMSTTPATPAATPGDLLALSVTAADPLGRPLTFTWEPSTGVLGAPEQTGGTSTARWTVLSCVPNDTPPTVGVIVTNSVGLSVRHTFEVAWTGPVCGHPPCEVKLAGNALTLEADCITDTPVFIPPGLTLDGQARLLTAADPVGGHFVGGILRNRGTEAHVRALKLRARGLMKEGPCDGGDDRLRGILLQGASGSVVDSEVLDIRRNRPVEGVPEGEPRGCLEGHGIEVRNQGTSERRAVELRGNRVTGYQKVGMVVVGAVDATVTDNTVTGAGPVGHIAQNGIQLSDGATGRVSGNRVASHSYTGEDVASGIVVAGGPLYGMELCREALIGGNTLLNNDIGIYLSQAELDGTGPATPTLLRVVDNTLQSDAVTNGYAYQAGVSDFGGGNLISGNLVSGAGYDRATQPGVTYDVDVVAGAASRVVFLSRPQQVAVGSCGRVVVQSQDAKGNLSRPDPGLFTLEASGPAAAGITFHADAQCSEQERITTVDLTTSQAEAGFYFKSTQAGPVKLSVSNTGVSGSDDVTVAP